MTIDEQLTTVFSKVFRMRITNTDFQVADIQQWDSLTHIKLVIELESAFFITIGPDDIKPLYSDFQTVKSYIESKLDDH
jgi:acyl carrier protein